MKLERQDKRLTMVVLHRGDSESVATFHDNTGEVCAVHRWDRLISPPAAAEEIRGYGYAVTPWERQEPGVYTAQIQVWHTRMLGDVGGWQKNAGQKEWPISPELDARIQEGIRLAKEEGRRRAQKVQEEAEAMRDRLEPMVPYPVKRRSEWKL